MLRRGVVWKTMGNIVFNADSVGGGRLPLNGKTFTMTARADEFAQYCGELLSAAGPCRAGNRRPVHRPGINHCRRSHALSFSR